jgi:hypothetical protein
VFVVKNLKKNFFGQCISSGGGDQLVLSWVLFEDPVFFLNPHIFFWVWFNCSCVVFFSFFLAHVNFRVWDPAMAGETFLSFLLVFGELLIGLDGLMGDMILVDLFYL